MKVAKWGNSFAIRLPNTLVESMALQEGDDIELVPAEHRKFDVIRQLSQRERIERLRELMKGTLPADYKFNREEANER